MAGTKQVQSCTEQPNLTLSLNNDLPPESLSQSMTKLDSKKGKPCDTKGIAEIKNMGSGGELAHLSKITGVVHATGDTLLSSRKSSRKIGVISHNKMNQQLSSEDQIENENKTEWKDGANDVSRGPVRKIVLKSLEDMCLYKSTEENRYSHSTPSVNGFMKKSNSQTKLDCVTETEATNGTLEKAAIHLVGDSVSRSVSKTTRITREQYSSKVDQANEPSTGRSDPTATELPFGSKMTATTAVSNVSNLKAAENCCHISNTTCFELSNREAMAPLPRVPEQPSFHENSPVVGNSSSMNNGGAAESKISSIMLLSTESPVLLAEVGVQTSFISTQSTSCSPESCPKRKRKPPKELVTRDVQTEKKVPKMFIKMMETKTSATTLPTSKPVTPEQHPISRKITISTLVKLSIPPKHTRAMEDRLLRRIMYFDSNQSSVCNKDVDFCTYRIHRSSKTTDPHKFSGNNQAYRECRSGKKCAEALKGQAGLTCDEIAIKVVSLELSPHAVSQLLKACYFIYIDYVFLGHVGNETFLAPVSASVHFDSRRSYCVSMQFNKKERSILKEQVNPTGLLAKDSIMFILVCHAAPEFDILKNWDFAYGYLSMKTMVEQNLKSDYTKCEIEMTRIGSTEKIGTLHLIFEGLKLVKTIRDEDFECIEPRPGVLFHKLTLDKKDVENNM